MDSQNDQTKAIVQELKDIKFQLLEIANQLRQLNNK